MKHQLKKKYKILRNLSSQNLIKNSEVLDFSTRLKIKKIITFFYGNLSAKQLKKNFTNSLSYKGKTALFFIHQLERRLDRNLLRAHFLTSNQQSKQLILHGFVYVNNKRIINPNYLLQPYDIVSFDIKILNNIKNEWLKNSSYHLEMIKFEKNYNLLINYKNFTFVYHPHLSYSSLKITPNQDIFIKLYDKKQKSFINVLLPTQYLSQLYQY
jgi:ribosomal protein S4